MNQRPPNNYQQEQQYRPQYPQQNNMAQLTNGMAQMRPPSQLSPPTGRRVYPGQQPQFVQQQSQQYQQSAPQQGQYQQFAPQQVQQPLQPAISFQSQPQQMQGQQQQFQESVPIQQPGFVQPGFNQPQASRQRIDPYQVPSTVQVQYEDQLLWDQSSYGTSSVQAPPLATSDFLCIDEGNSGPRFIRATTYNMPSTNELANQTGLPLGIVIQPMAHVPSNEQDIQVVQFPTKSPVRCSRCQGYMNPYMKFVDGGRKFVCNICQFGGSEVPNEYFAQLGMNNVRLDIAERPELRYGTIDVLASPEFCIRKAKAASFVFLLDVSMASLQNGMLELACNTLAGMLDLLPEDEEGNSPCRIAIVAYDRAVHFFDLNSGKTAPVMLTVSDIQDAFVPLESGFCVSPVESREVILQLLKDLPKLFAHNRSTEACVGAAVTGALKGLELTGGRLILLHSSLPSFGPGTLRAREDPSIFNTDKEKSLFQPGDDYYVKLGEKCSSSGVGVDMFLFAQQYIDVASFGPLSAITGGQTHLYPGFHYQRDGFKFEEELRRIVTREFGYDCLLRVRCGNGLRVSEHLGSFFLKNTTDVEIGVVDSEKALAVQFKHEGKLDDNGEVHVQVAMLYTSPIGQRLIRVLNLRFATTNVLTEVFKRADVDTCANMLTKAAINQTLSSSLKDVRDQLTDVCVVILAAYRQSCASTSAPGQLVLPETLKLFPMFQLAVLKSKAFRNGNDLSSDIRVGAMRFIRNIGVGTSTVYLYPRLFGLHNILEGQGEFNPTLNHFVMPTSIRPSSMFLEDVGVYLIENTELLLIFVMRNASQQFISDVFEADSFQNIDIKLRQLPVLQNVLSIKIRSILAYIQDEQRRGLYPQMQIVKQGEPMEVLFRNMLVEDKNNENQDYVDYLCLCHKMIQERMKT